MLFNRRPKGRAEQNRVSDTSTKPKNTVQIDKPNLNQGGRSEKKKNSQWFFIK